MLCLAGPTGSVIRCRSPQASSTSTELINHQVSTSASKGIDAPIRLHARHNTVTSSTDEL